MIKFLSSRAGGLGEINQGINIDFGAAKDKVSKQWKRFQLLIVVKVVEKKELPTWISESTVRTAEDQVTRKCGSHLNCGRVRPDNLYGVKLNKLNGKRLL